MSPAFSLCAIYSKPWCCSIYSDWRCSQNSSRKLPRHMSRPVWCGWNSSTLKSWVVGHMLSLPIHQLTSTPITVGGRGALQKGQGGGRWGKVGRRGVMWPGTSNHCTLTSEICRCWSGSDVTLWWPAGTNTICYIPSRTHESTGTVCTVKECIKYSTST